MFSKDDLAKMLFIDIETVRGESSYESLKPGLQQMWEAKARYISSEEEKSPAEKYYERAGIYAEFGKVVCISLGRIHWKEEEPQFILRSFFGEDEALILSQFKRLLDEARFRGWSLCAHNGKEFDFPYLCRRYLINQIPLPRILQVQGKKPWEVPFLDTMELWKFGDYKNYTKLELLCQVFGIPSPKDDIDGSQVGKVFWEESAVDRIAQYCEKDVLATAQVMLRYANLSLIQDEGIRSNL
ncbi:MAG: 3'-5' exonuclease [Bacteroidota bacterium]